MIFLWSCANQVPLTGGPKDEDPPLLDTAASFQNEQVYFSKSDIELHFDEYIDLKNITKKLLVSPPLEYNPQVKSRLKTVQLSFDEREQLKDSTTYVINFGDAISDYTESNSVKNFTLVFSTGAYIDSLTIKGNVYDGRSQKPLEDYTVMLYTDLRDSVVFKDKPYYFAKTDDRGNFYIHNLRADSFKIFVLNDKNLDYLFDPANEEVGFLSEPLVLPYDDSIELQIPCFMEDTPPQFKTYELKNLGWIQLEFSKVPLLTDIQVLHSDSIDYHIAVENDQLLNIWYSDLNLSSMQLVYNITDTISVRINKRTTEVRDTIYDLKIHPDQNEILHYRDTITLVSSQPISSFDTSLMRLIDTLAGDSLVLSCYPDHSDRRLLHCRSGWSPGSQYIYELMSGAVTDLWGYSSSTITSDISIGKDEDFGSLQLNIINVPTDTTYTFVIWHKKNEILRELVKNDTVIKRPSILPADYEIEIIEDLNSNRRWDTGHYLQKKNAERIFDKIKVNEIKANWSTSQTIDILDLYNNTTTDDETENQ